MPDYPSYRYRDNDTGESFDMPWAGPSEPTDRDIDLYRYQQRQNEANSWGNRIKSWIPDPLENAWSSATTGIGNAWTELNRPTSDLPSRMAREATAASGGRPLSMPFMGFNLPVPARAVETVGDVYSDQTSPLNLGLNAMSLGGYGMARGLGSTALARLAAMGQTAAGGATAAAGGINLLGAEDSGDVASSLLQMSLGGLGTKFGLDELKGYRPGIEPGPITDPRRLLPESTSGPRFEAGPGGVRDFQSPSPDLTPPFAEAPPLIDLEMPTGPSPVGAAPELQMRTVNPRGPSNLQPFEQDASIFQQMRQEPVLGDVTDPSIGPRPQVPQVEQFGPSPDLTLPRRTVFGAPIEEGIPTTTIEPPTAGGLADDFGDISPADILDVSPETTLDDAVSIAGPRVGQPPAPRNIEEARAYAEAMTPAPTPPPPIPVRPAVPKPPTPDRILRLGRGANDPVRTIFPDKLHADLYSAMGRFKKQTRGQTGIKPDFEGLARQMGVSVKDVTRIASEYRNRVNALAKELPATIEGGVGQMEAPHWSGKTPEMVQPPPTPPPVAAAPPPLSKSAQRRAAWEAEKAQRAAETAAAGPAAELNAALEARGATPTPAPVAEKPSLPKSKKARVTAVMDELVAGGSEGMVDIANDPAKLLATAKRAGIKTGTLKAAIADFMKNEEGFLQLPTKQQLKDWTGKTFDAANQLRMTSLLSGLALPKSFAGNLGAHLAAALEDRSIEPLKVLLNYKQIGKDVAEGWKSLANPVAVGGFGRVNLPGRAMGALDYASIKSLRRAGLSEKEAKELLLTGSNAISAMKGMNSPLAKYFIPFRTTPVNQIMQGFTRIHKHPEVWIGAMAAGAAVGTKVQDKEKLALMSAFAGPYALPFLAGAAYATGDYETFGSLSPIPEWGLSQSLENPFKSITQSPGRRWTRSNLGFGKLAEKEKRIERGQRVGEKRGGGRSRRSKR